MSKYDLKFPIEVDGKTISTLTLRRPKGRDMVAIGDHVSALARFYAANAVAMQGSLQAAVAAGVKAAQEGADAPNPDDLGGIDETKLTPPDGAVYAAMVAIAAQLADLGDAAGDLDLVDLQEIAARALNPGEAPGRGGTRSGGEQ